MIPIVYRDIDSYSVPIWSTYQKQNVNRWPVLSRWLEENLIDNLERWLKFSHIDYRSLKGWLELISLLSCLAFMLLHRSFSNGDFSFPYSNFLISKIDHIREWWFLILVQWFPKLIHRLLKLGRRFKIHTTFDTFGLRYPWLSQQQHTLTWIEQLPCSRRAPEIRDWNLNQGHVINKRAHVYHP